MNKIEFRGPLLVTGSSRSGTSYLYRLVKSLPGVVLTYESNIIKEAFDAFLMRDVLASRSIFSAYLDRLKYVGTRSGRNMLFEHPPEFYDQLFESFRQHRDFRRFIVDLYCAGRQCKIWGDKCEIAQIETIGNLFPELRVLWIVRDPRSVACSFSEHSAGNLYVTSLAWVNAARQALKFRETLGSDSVFIIQYEDLVTGPLDLLRNIAAFIGTPEFDDLSMVTRAHTASIEKWRNLLTPHQTKRIEEICFDEMAHYGYEPSYASAMKRMNPFYYGLYSIQHAAGLLRKRRYRVREFFRLGTLMKWIRNYSNWGQ